MKKAKRSKVAAEIFEGLAELELMVATEKALAAEVAVLHKRWRKLEAFERREACKWRKARKALLRLPAKLREPLRAAKSSVEVRRVLEDAIQAVFVTFSKGTGKARR